MVLSKKIKEARTAKKLSQEKLAFKAGVPVGTIYKIENKSLDPRFSTLTRIAEALGISLDSLK